ncbi:MAG: hypothetical protein N3F04_00085 [Candidatus Nezhaarchaeota archaeon]|nr:hypothetical protein [Candidatus Nezhaarchaeota archaeon]MCX8141172.1 hypothetical protein [Candidatus Nezhaarchaeota archaeon]MDW8050825.1 hypothetical protein [Nitrososphaerota archaeon]
MSEQVFKRWVSLRIVLMLVLGVITIVVAPIIGHYRGFYLCLTLGGIIVITSIVYLAVIYLGKGDVKWMASKSIQCLWVCTSMGIGYMVTSLAPYFNIAIPIGVLLFVVGLIMTVIGAYYLVTISRRTGIPLSI